MIVRHFATSTPLCRRILLAGLATGLVACDGGTDNPAHQAASAAPTTVIADKRWLDMHDPTPPEQWLASREAARDLGRSAATVASFGNLLARAHRHYTETPRMIANRAAQIEEMLRARGIDESARLVIEGLVGAGSDERRRGFGEAGQHYFNIRMTGASRDQALQALARTAAETPR
ncbi:hypothetical protein RA307_15660 [Xanthobacteraceae bacterium Astr-EGSB]|uniref:hypothetical protein n=1 Tax=Astrobacterium formosum TaxID=3069710 RepID=UPI0027B53FB2|nr:hypothetical protein [Xanthobacteraceae bacterium Astr-EGSB]